MLQITADELPRFMACNGSRLMEDFKSSVVVNDIDRSEGIAAHWVIEQVFYKRHTLDELIDRQAPNGVFITDEMVENVTPYLESVQDRGAMEHVTSFVGGGNTPWSISGRADHISAEHGVITITDFKYGWSIVEPENNWTLIAHGIGYALGLVHHKNVNLERDIKEIKFVIYQPRPYHPSGKVRTWSITPKDLVEYHKQLDATLTKPSDVLNTSTHCKHCTAMVYCPAFRKAQMNTLEETERVFNDVIDNETLSFMLDNTKRAIDILKQSYDAYSDLATHRLREGQIVTGYAVQNDLTNRQWKDFVTPETVQILTGRDITKKQLVTPNQAEKAGVAKELIESLCERRNKGFKLVRVNVDALAKKLFN